MYRDLHFIPLIAGALVFGLKGAVLMFLFINSLYFPYIFVTWSGSFILEADRFLDIAISGVVALMTGYFLERQKRYEKQLEKDKLELKELDRLKSAFLANISHELRTPMISIIGYADLLLDKVDGPLNDEQENSLKKVAAHAKRLQQLINDTLDVSRMESGGMPKLNLKEIKIKPLIESVIPAFEPMIREKGLKLTVDIDEGLPAIYGDEGKVNRILGNLLSNAVKFTNAGGIAISARPSVRGIKKGESPTFAEVCVEDTGIGIKEEDIGKIFDKFSQVDFTLSRGYEGAGLGLSIAENLVRLHKGEIWVDSEYGKGSRFCITLPFNRLLKRNSKRQVTF
ncbi:MAG: HAMP domain-containing sensor histidine kinase [Nitrospirota bacterium]